MRLFNKSRNAYSKSFEFLESIKSDKDELCDPPIEAQAALDVIFQILVNDKDQYSYLTTIPESTKQTNRIMLDMILSKYSRKYRRWKKKRLKDWSRLWRPI